MALTIYIPTLRAGERLARTLRALEEQEMRPEVVIADNSEERPGGSSRANGSPGYAQRRVR